MPVNTLTMSMHKPSTSTIRRKPQHTYRSPCANQTDSSTVTLLRLSTSSPKPKQGSSSNKTPPQSRTSETNTSPISPPTPKRRRYSMNPPLPLYHPLGPLALSLPPLNAAAYGLPPVPRSMMVESEALLKSLGDGPDVDEEALGSAGVSPPAAPATARDAPKDKPMRRRRAGGQRRKRKEPDDSDAPYANPPKRTRHPRGNKVKEQETSTTPTTSRNPAKRRESSTPTGSDAATPDPVAAPTPNDDEDAM